MGPETQGAVNALIIGADVIARLGLRTLLQVSSQVAVAGEAEGGAAAIARLRQLAPHVVLLHAQTTGAELLAELREFARYAPVLLLANDESAPAVERALRTGATGYLINGQYGVDELIDAVLAVDEVAGRAGAQGPLNRGGRLVVREQEYRCVARELP